MFKFVPTSVTGIITRFGKFNRKVDPGLNFYIPIIEKYYPVSNRSNITKLSQQIKTRDNVFAYINSSVQTVVKNENSVNAFFLTDNLQRQLESQIENVIRIASSKMSIDEIFSSYDLILSEINTKIKNDMEKFGLTIENFYINEITPDKEVKNAMNAINASERLKIAATNNAEAEYIKKVRDGEADRERKRLIGEGVSLQRSAIISGYEKYLQNMVQKSGLSPKEILDFCREIQHLDVMETIGQTPNSKILFMDTKIPSTTRELISAKQTE